MITTIINEDQLTVAQLIDILSKMPQDKFVWIQGPNEYICVEKVWQERGEDVVIGENWD